MTTGVGGLIVSVNVPVPVPPTLVAPNGTLEVPVRVVVPEIRPLAVFTESPVGRPVAV